MTTVKTCKWHNKWQRACNEWMVYLLKFYLEGIVAIFHPLNVFPFRSLQVSLSEHYRCVCHVLLKGKIIRDLWHRKKRNKIIKRRKKSPWCLHQRIYRLLQQSLMKWWVKFLLLFFRRITMKDFDWWVSDEPIKVNLLKHSTHGNFCPLFRVVQLILVSALFRSRAFYERMRLKIIFEVLLFSMSGKRSFN